jgi:hypothetical protein
MMLVVGDVPPVNALHTKFVMVSVAVMLVSASLVVVVTLNVHVVAQVGALIVTSAAASFVVSAVTMFVAIVLRPSAFPLESVTANHWQLVPVHAPL